MMLGTITLHPAHEDQQQLWGQQQGAPDEQHLAAALQQPLLPPLDYRRLKRDLADGDDQLAARVMQVGRGVAARQCSTQHTVAGNDAGSWAARCVSPCCNAEWQILTRCTASVNRRR